MAADIQPSSPEHKPRSRHERLESHTYVGLIVCGTALGWLIGLSASPVVGTVVAAVVAALVALQTALAGLHDEKSNSENLTSRIMKSKVNVWPLAVLALGLAAGSCLGITARTHDWFSPSLSTMMRRWTDAGLDPKLVKTRFFENLHPKVTERDLDRSVLFATEGRSDCTKLKLTEDKDLRREMLGSTIPGVAQFAGKVDNPAALRAAVESFVCE